jgi:predicted nucleic acid-binding protein
VILLDTTICIHVINARPLGALDTMIAAHAVSRARW